MLFDWDKSMWAEGERYKAGKAAAIINKGIGDYETLGVDMGASYAKGFRDGIKELQAEKAVQEMIHPTKPDPFTEFVSRLKP